MDSAFATGYKMKQRNKSKKLSAFLMLILLSLFFCSCSALPQTTRTAALQAYSLLSAPSSAHGATPASETPHSVDAGSQAKSSPDVSNPAVPMGDWATMLINPTHFIPKDF
ncbi:MAG: hypothetical protein N2376_10635, partial [Clostridia bacterium]|nr:hypothetical protein [Clostridia bacterium]